MTTSTSAVAEWETDFDVLAPEYLSDPFRIWDELRERCPIAHTERRGSTWLPTTYEDVTAIAHDVDRFSSIEVAVIPFEGEEPDQPVLIYGLPPISTDPPLHTWTRRLLLPWFSHKRVEDYEVVTHALCRSLIDRFIDTGVADAATDYAQHIPVRVIALILGVQAELEETFTDWVRGVLEFAEDHEHRLASMQALVNYFMTELERRRVEPGDDLLSSLIHAEVDGAPVEDSVTLGIAALVMIAGIDTSWSAIGSSLWHLATHPEDRRRLVAEPELMTLAVEELLRAYSPVTMARIVTADGEYGGCPMKKGDKVLMNFPAANRDPAMFEDPSQVKLDRAINRHVAFGSGIHRCAGSNLARMELRVALEEWLARIPEFGLADGAEVTWCGGQVRGPRRLPVVLR